MVESQGCIGAFFNVREDSAQSGAVEPRPILPTTSITMVAYMPETERSKTEQRPNVNASTAGKPLPVSCMLLRHAWAAYIPHR